MYKTKISARPPGIIRAFGCRFPAAGLAVALSASAAAASQAGFLATAPAITPLAARLTDPLVLSLALFAFACLLAAIAFRARAQAAHRDRSHSEAVLGETRRSHASLHDAFIATEDMDKPMAEVLSDLADAIRRGFADPDALSVRIALLGALHDEIGDTDPAHSLTRTIPHIPAGSGAITVAYGAPRPSPPFSKAEEATLTLIASRVGGRGLGMQSQRDLRQNEEVFRKVYSQQAFAALVVRDGRFAEANDAAARILGYDGPLDLIGKTPLDISPPLQPDGQSSAAASAAIQARMEAMEPCHFEWEHRRKNGEAVLVDVYTTSARDGAGRTVTYVMWNDITLRRHAEEVLAAYQRTLEAQVALRTEELSRLYDELNAIVSTAGSGIALVRDGVIVTGNRALSTMLMMDEAALSGLSGRALFRDQAEWDLLLTQAEQALAQGLRFDLEQELLRSDGSSFWGRLRASAVDPADPARGAVWVLDDVTPDRNARHELAQARKVAEQAVQLKSDFLAEMSHEIRSPINAVLGFTEILLSTPLSGLQLDYLRKVQTSGRHLLMIINDILDMSKVEAGKMRIEATEFDLRPTLYSALDAVTQIAADKDLELLVDTDTALPDRFIGDPLRMSQILINLLSNAVKFTPSGSVLLSVRPDTAANARPGLRFTVTDTGVGMTPDQVERLFQPFTQADDSTARLYGGTGLGLSICKQIVSLMGGDIGVTSTKGAGSSFWFIVPLQAVSDAHTPATPPRLSGQRVLVVDDHKGARDLMARHLAAAGLQVETAGDGMAAIAQALQARKSGQPFAVILVDRKMPRMSGIDCARRLRKVAGGARVLLLSSRDGQDLIDLIETEGIDALVIKPAPPDRLVTVIADALARDAARPEPHKATTPKARARERDARHIPDAAPASPAMAPPDGAASWSGYRALVVDDNAINRELASAMLAKKGFEVQGAGNGAEALEAVLRHDFDIVLLDGQMPVMDGFETARRIRALPTAKGKVPIIGLTGHWGETQRDAGMEAGMNAYLVKPVMLADLLAALRTCLPHPDRPH